MADSSLKDKTAKGLLWGGIGNGGMQVLNLIFGIFLARLLDSTDYGMVAVLTIFSAMAGVFTESGFIMALVNKKDATPEDYNAVFWFNITVGAIIYIILFFCTPLIARFYNTPDLVRLAHFQFLGFVFSSFGTAPTAYLVRNLMVKQRSVVTIVAMTLSGIVGLVMAFNGYGYWSLATQTVVYTALTSILLWSVVRLKLSFRIRFQTIRELFPFGSKLLITSLFTNINNNVFSSLIGRFYSIREAGYFSQGNKWVMMGSMSILGTLNGIGQPVLRQAVGDNDRQKNIFRKLLRFTAFVCFPMMFGLGIVSKEVIVITVTEKWLPSVPVMQLLCVWGAFMPISSLYVSLVNSLNRPNIYMWNTIALGLLQLACLVLSYPMGLNFMISAFVTVNILWLFVWQHFAHKYIGLTMNDVVRDTLPYLAITLGVMAVTIFLTRPIENMYLSLIAKILIAGGLYVGSMWMLGSQIFKESVDYLLKRKKFE